MNRQRPFDKLARFAADASASREELGRNYAAELLQDPDAFDPKKLMRLGRSGLASFVQAVGVPTVKIKEASELRQADIQPNEEPGGWADERKVPMPFELRGFLIGTVAGGVILFAITFLLVMF